MLDTNALLGFAFSIIASFTNAIGPSPWPAPSKPDDLLRCVIGRPGSPTHLILTHHNGTEFWIDNGATYRYSTLGSFFTLQDPSRVPEFAGSTSLTSNDVVQIARKALSGLVKSGDPLSDGHPTVRYASEYLGKRIPFFRVIWPKSTPGDPAAEVEIDGRTGTIVRLNLRAEGFHDPALHEQIKKKVHAPEPVKPSIPLDQAGLLKPSTNYVVEAIASWRAFCKAFNIDPGANTTLEDVNWVLSCEASSPSIGIWSNGVCVAPQCHIRFNSGACFDSIGGVVSSHFAADAAFRRGNESPPITSWGPFEGQPQKRWQDLAEDLETRISERLGVPKAFFERLHARLRSPAELSPGHPLKRAMVSWRRLPQRPDEPGLSEAERARLRGLYGEWWTGELRYGRPVKEWVLDGMPDRLLAEFDLQTGEIKSIDFSLRPQLSWPGLNALKPRR